MIFLTFYRPIRTYWVFPPSSTSPCLNDGISLEVSAILNTITEAFMATLPLIAVFKLGVKKEQRLSVIGLLCLGYIVVIVAILRTFYVFKAMTTMDVFWWGGPQWICSEAELHIAVVSFHF
jgi:hypothetical protein